MDDWNGQRQSTSVVGRIVYGNRPILSKDSKGKGRLGVCQGVVAQTSQFHAGDPGIQALFCWLVQFKPRFEDDVTPILKDAEEDETILRANTTVCYVLRLTDLQQVLCWFLVRRRF
ncbi:hypothetical protein RRF57_010411 [Xylaria bambusicola]|uniref:Uncharacterized protein n=1 Tax=Xylaria bambusicola TaxID=326684 RepID=A0AAN7UWK6_9PEZI